MLDFLKINLFLSTLKDIYTRPVHFFRTYSTLVTTRQGHLWTLNQDNDDDPYMNPVAFAALCVVISNLILPVVLYLGVQAGAVSPDYVAFADWAKSKGYLKPMSITGVIFLDDLLRKALVLFMLYTLGWLISVYSGSKIPARFATGYFFYWNAWSLLSSLVTLVMIVAGIVFPVYQTGLPSLLNTIISLLSLFMFLGFPIVYWPQWVEATRKRVTLALLGGLVTWIILLAILLPMLAPMPDVSQAPGFQPRWERQW